MTCLQTTPKKTTPKKKTSHSSSDDEKKEKGPPSLHYKIHYDHQHRSLFVKVIECRNLVKADAFGGKPDPYVEVSLGPGSFKEMKTK